MAKPTDWFSIIFSGLGIIGGTFYGVGLIVWLLKYARTLIGNPLAIVALARTALRVWIKNRAFRLVKSEMEQALAYRDQYWMGEIDSLREQFANTPTGPIPPERLRDLIVLCHPDKHGGVQRALATTRWLLSQRRAA
jgi:hypothetical protein